MAVNTAFFPAGGKGVAGQTQTIALGAGSGTSQTVQVGSSISQGNNALMVTGWNANAAGGTQIQAYVRITVEVSGSIAATLTDFPFIMPPQTTTIRLFASPNPAGTYNIAVIVTVTPSIAGSAMWFTPGSGGFGP